MLGWPTYAPIYLRKPLAHFPQTTNVFCVCRSFPMSVSQPSQSATRSRYKWDISKCLPRSWAYTYRTTLSLWFLLSSGIMHCRRALCHLPNCGVSCSTLQIANRAKIVLAQHRQLEQKSSQIYAQCSTSKEKDQQVTISKANWCQHQVYREQN